MKNKLFVISSLQICIYLLNRLTIDFIGIIKYQNLSALSNDNVITYLVFKYAIFKLMQNN